MTTSSVVSHRSTTTRRTPPEHHRTATEVLRNSGHPPCPCCSLLGDDCEHREALLSFAQRSFYFVAVCSSRAMFRSSWLIVRPCDRDVVGNASKHGVVSACGLQDGARNEL